MNNKRDMISYETILRFMRYSGESLPGFRIECDPQRYAIRRDSWIEDRGQIFETWLEAGYVGTTQVYQVCYLFEEAQAHDKN